VNRTVDHAADWRQLDAQIQLHVCPWLNSLPVRNIIV
jgi:hypothetical protein